MSGDSGEDTVKLGLTVREVGLAGREVFLRVLTQPDKEPSEWASEQWAECAERVKAVCDQEKEVAWEGLVNQVAAHFYGYRFVEEAESLPAAQRIGWEAAVRTMVNWCAAEDVEDRREIERFDWSAWAKERILGWENGKPTLDS